MLHLETESFHASFLAPKYCLNYKNGSTNVFLEKEVLQKPEEFKEDVTLSIKQLKAVACWIFLFKEFVNLCISMYFSDIVKAQ